MKNMIGVVVLLGTLTLAASAQSITGCRLSSNQYDPNSTSNVYGRCGSCYSPDSINNPYGKYGNPYSTNSVTNPYATSAPTITAEDGTYLGRYSANQFAVDSISNRFGQHGSLFTPNSINNNSGLYGSPYSSQSPHNPYTVAAPVFSDDSDDQ